MTTDTYYEDDREDDDEWDWTQFTRFPEIGV